MSLFLEMYSLPSAHRQVGLLSGTGVEYCGGRVRLFVCLSVREHIAGKALPIFAIFAHVIPTAVARSSSGGVAICYV